jgi:uncharacterized protein involved in response to NO
MHRMRRFIEGWPMNEKLERLPHGRERAVLFAYGFRPFFLAALAYALIAMVAWIAVRVLGASPLAALPPQLWHAHEMLFGFITAAIAGFLLTAVPSWTGARGFAGWPLVVLASLWLLGRIAFAAPSHLSLWVLATAELAFLPGLALLIALPLLRSRNRNTPLLLVIGVLWLADATFMCALALGDVALARKTVLAGIDVVLLLITVIGGRIVPAFTANALRRGGIVAFVRSSRWLDMATIAAMVLVLGTDTFARLQPAAVVAAGLAAVLHATRLAGWQGLRSSREPIVWILHVAYAWLPIGLALKAVYLSSGAEWAADWLHALTVGAAATMIVAVVTRASLGHTGRPLIAPVSAAIAYTVLCVGALVRAFATTLGAYREGAIWTSGLSWVVAFALLLGAYAPILVRARADGKPG